MIKIERRVSTDTLRTAAERRRPSPPADTHALSRAPDIRPTLDCVATTGGKASTPAWQAVLGHNDPTAPLVPDPTAPLVSHEYSRPAYQEAAPFTKAAWDALKPAQAKTYPLRNSTDCPYCGAAHKHEVTRCPDVAAVEFFRDGAVKRVELRR